MECKPTTTGVLKPCRKLCGPLCYLPWFEVFYKLLNILADYTAKCQDSQWYELLETLYKLPIPEPGTSVHLSVEGRPRPPGGFWIKFVGSSGKIQTYIRVLVERPEEK
uniref:Uncharacterized protein n=1 Tax=Sphaerodactylus townsendi TaxID=933632 RepID=A0ACB8EZ81_9SAUR